MSESKAHKTKGSIVKKLKPSEECAICLEEIKEGQKIKKLGCGHKFHKNCINDAMKFNRKCPLCRDLIPSNGRYLKHAPIDAPLKFRMDQALRPPLYNSDFDEEIEEFAEGATKKMIDSQIETNKESIFLEVIVFYRDGLNRLKHLKTYSNKDLGLNYKSRRENLKTAILIHAKDLAIECPMFTIPNNAVNYPYFSGNPAFTIDKMYFGTPAGIKEDGYAIADYPSDIHADMPYRYKEVDTLSFHPGDFNPGGMVQDPSKRFKKEIYIDDIQFHSFYTLEQAYGQYMHKAKTQILYGSEYHLEFPSLNAVLNNPHPIAYIIVELGCGYYNNTVSSRVGTIGRKGGKKTQRNKLQKQNKSRRRRNRSAN